MKFWMESEITLRFGGYGTVWYDSLFLGRNGSVSVGCLLATYSLVGQ
jgi:hypothetical protein